MSLKGLPLSLNKNLNKEKRAKQEGSGELTNALSALQPQEGCRVGGTPANRTHPNLWDKPCKTP